MAERTLNQDLRETPHEIWCKAIMLCDMTFDVLSDSMLPGSIKNEYFQEIEACIAKASEFLSTGDEAGLKAIHQHSLAVYIECEERIEIAMKPVFVEAV